MDFRKIYDECNLPTKRIKSFPEILFECNIRSLFEQVLKENIKFKHGLSKIEDLVILDVTKNPDKVDNAIREILRRDIRTDTSFPDSTSRTLPGFLDEDGEYITFDDWLDTIINEIRQKVAGKSYFGVLENKLIYIKGRFQKIYDETMCELAA